MTDTIDTSRLSPAELDDLALELGRGLLNLDRTKPAAIYLAAVAAGQPMVHVHIPGLMTGDCVLLSTNLDGSRWVLPWHGSHILIEARYCTSPTHQGYRATDPATAREAWEGQNPGNISANQLKVLLALRDAGDYGMIDHDHEQINGLEQDTAGKRRKDLQERGLVAAKHGFKRQSPRGVNAQVWIITTAGQQALRSDRPPSLTHLIAMAG